MLITSMDNKKIKNLVKLNQKKYRDMTNKFVVETENLIKEAYINNVLEELYILDGESLSFEADVLTYYVTENVMSKIKNINTSKFIGVCSKKESNEYIGMRYLMLDKIADPGNLGTIIRSAVAFDIDTIIISEDSCDVYNDKVIRATEGALFKINIMKENLLVSLNNLNKLNIPVYGTDVLKGDSLDIISHDKFCIVMGNEGFGISDAVKEKINKFVHLSTNNVESLNVAIATSIILYELNKK